MLLGDNATQLSVRLLDNMAQGRGDTLPLDTVSTNIRGVCMFEQAGKSGVSCLLTLRAVVVHS